jgi:hypothetical protein
MTLGFSKHKGGDQVTFGFYWNRTEWEAQIVPAAGGVLTGDAATRYLRMPALALLVVMPLMGAAYAIFLPFIGIAMFVAFLFGRLRAALTGTTPPAVEMRPAVPMVPRDRKKAAAETDLPRAA